MPFQTMRNWNYGDTVPFSDMQILSDNIQFIYDQLGGSVDIIEPAVLQSTSGPKTQVNRYRWLLYSDNGTIEDPSGVGASVILSNPDPDYPYYDLYSISWLHVGKTYRVVDVDTFYEVENPVVT